MNVKYLPFNKASDLYIVDSSVKARVATAAVALAISNTLSLPSSEVGTHEDYFSGQLRGSFNSIVSEWNEEVVMDAKECVEMIRMFWTVRYYAAYPANRPIYSDNAAFWDSLFSVKTFVSPTVNAFLATNITSVIELSKVATIVMSNKE